MSNGLNFYMWLVEKHETLSVILNKISEGEDIFPHEDYLFNQYKEFCKEA